MISGRILEDKTCWGLAVRKNPTGVPSIDSALIPAVTDHAEAPKLSAEMTLVLDGRTDEHQGLVVNEFLRLWRVQPSMTLGLVGNCH